MASLHLVLPHGLGMRRHVTDSLRKWRKEFLRGKGPGQNTSNRHLLQTCMQMIVSPHDEYYKGSAVRSCGDRGGVINSTGYVLDKDK